MANNYVTINKMEKVGKLTVHIKYSKQFRVRIWLASQLIKVVGFVLGCGAEVNIDG